MVQTTDDGSVAYGEMCWYLLYIQLQNQQKF
jgi:hypothetical protein